MQELPESNDLRLSPDAKRAARSLDLAQQRVPGGILPIIGAALLAQRCTAPAQSSRSQKLGARRRVGANRASPPATRQGTDIMNDEIRRSVLRGWLGVAAITASLFVFLTTELMPVGLLTPLSGSLGIAVGVASLMVTLYGVSAGLGVPFIVAWTRRVNRRTLLSVAVAILALGNLLVSVSPNFAVILTTRLVMGFANGVFWAIGVSMAMRIVPERHAGRASAVVMSGISIATVVGLPVGIFLENVTSWRTTFLIWAVLSALVFVAVAALVPSLPSANAISAREVFRLPRDNRSLRLVLSTVVLFVLGHFGAYTFVRPFLEQRSAASSGIITVVLMIYGVAAAAGNFIAGRTVAIHLNGTFLAGCAALLLALLLLLAAGGSTLGAAGALGVWGLAFGAVQLAQINMTLTAAPDTFEAAMSLNTMAYNTSIALGALFGGLLADSLGITSVAWFGIALTVGSLVLNLSSRRAPAMAKDAVATTAERPPPPTSRSQAGSTSSR